MDRPLSEFEQEIARRCFERVKWNRPQLEAAVVAALAMRREHASDATREALAWRRATGRRWTRCPGYGYRWYRGRRVPDDYERRVMACVLIWKERGYSWQQIARCLMLNQIRTSDNREWSVSRCRRAARVAARFRLEGQLPAIPETPIATAVGSC